MSAETRRAAGIAGDNILDAESQAWLRVLGHANSGERSAGQARLHELLLRIARREVRRRGTTLRLSGPELDDLAYQSAADAMMAITGKLSTFRGDSRFTTWAYRFVILEVSAKIGRHFWRERGVSFDAEDWDRLPDRFGLHPVREAEGRDLAAAVRHAVEQELTDRQRRVFVAVVLNGVPLDALIVELNTNRNAIYKTMFDARRKLRAALVAKGYLSSSDVSTRMSDRTALDQFLQTDPRDVGCEQAMEILHVYVEMVASGGAAKERLAGVAAHLAACGPCSEDFNGLLAAVS